MKRRDIVKKLKRLAKEHSLPYYEKEGGNHTKCYIGEAHVTLPRHKEINELTAQGIIKEAHAWFEK